MGNQAGQCNHRREGYLDRACGCLLGLAVGDALGAPLEFMPRDSRPRHTEMTGGGAHGLKPGEWTDDTSLAIALAESLLARARLDERDLMERFVAWYETGAYSCSGACFDIGLTTRRALDRFMATGELYAPSASPGAGNGSLMRLAPVVLFARGNAGEARHLAHAQSRTTHGSAEAVEACELMAVILSDALEGRGKAALEPRDWAGVATIGGIAAGSWRGKSRDGISSSGYVVHTLEAALWAVERSATFEDALVDAVNLGDDADTVGAVTGQLAGAVWGASTIPRRWLAPLAWRARIEQLALNLCGVRQGGA